MHSRLQTYCGALAEASWLTAAVTVPLFFNISSAETFEPDKMFVLKFLAVIAGVAFLLKRIAVERPQKKAGENEISFRSLLRHPLAASVAALAAVYTLSSLVSVAPSISWFGLYKRAQGTLAFYSYVIMFLVVFCELRSSSQLKRLQYAFILTSIPVASYTILQHFNRDPLPWNAFYGRASGNMGNPIFLGAYLIMVIPLTVGRLLDAAPLFRVEANRKAGIALACCCGLALALQVSALFFSQSRGPVIGLTVAAYICAFLFLVLRRSPADARAIYPAFAIGLGCLSPTSLAVIIYFVSSAPKLVSAAILGAALIGIAIVYWIVWRTSWGRSWLWLTWGGRAEWSARYTLFPPQARYWERSPPVSISSCGSVPGQRYGWWLRYWHSRRFWRGYPGEFEAGGGFQFKIAPYGY